MTSRQRWTLLATIIGSGAVFLDGTIVNVALPRIGRELPATFVGVLEGQTYIVSGYLAVLAALLILAGALSDRFGRRRTYVIGIAGFAITSALCGLAPTFEWLIVFRLLQGAAGALMIPGALSIITQTFAAEERGRAFGIWTSATSGLVLLGPLLGGLVVDTIGWRFAFLVNVPFLAVALWIALRHVEESRDLGRPGRFDWLGSIVAAIAVGGLSFGIIRGGEQEWADPLAWASIVAGGIALVMFPVLMATRPDPLVPLALFRSRTFSSINVATFFIYGALYVALSYQGLVLQGVLHYSALAAGAAGLPMGLCLAFFSTRIGAVAGRIGARPFMTAGPLIMTVGLLWFTRLPVDSDPWLAAVQAPASLVPPLDFVVDILPAVLLFGIGMSLIVAPLTNTLMGSIPVRFSGLGSAINNAISRVGQPLLGALIFVAISATFYANLGTLVPGLDPADPAVRTTFAPLNPPRSGASPADVAAAAQASVLAFHDAMRVAVVLLLIASAVSWFGLRDTDRAGARVAARSERPRADA
ncbi:MAG TPA: MFS transporter [Candidatus Limnocylindrales bacterium]|nr:MFS transporter [Candidatus Limnocylindrales bacterium]